MYTKMYEMVKNDIDNMSDAEVNNFISTVWDLRDHGMSDYEIASNLHFDTAIELRTAYSYAKKIQKECTIERCKALKERGKTNTEIANLLNISESTVRTYLKGNNDMDKNLMTMDTVLIDFEKLKNMSRHRLVMELGKCPNELIMKHGFSEDEAMTFVQNVIRLYGEIRTRDEDVKSSIIEEFDTIAAAENN